MSASHLSYRVTSRHGRRRRWAPGAAVLAVALALPLAGCALLPPRHRPPAPAASYHAPSTAAQHHRALAASRPGSGGSAAAASRLHPAAASSSPAPVQVVGLSQDAVRRLLGAPAAEASQGPGQTWTYEAAGCRVEIGFFYDVTRNGFFALSERQSDGGDAAACLGRIHDAHVS